MSLQGKKVYCELANLIGQHRADHFLVKTVLGKFSAQLLVADLNYVPDHQDIGLIIRTIRLDTEFLWFTLSSPSVPPHQKASPWTSTLGMSYSHCQPIKIVLFPLPQTLDDLEMLCSTALKSCFTTLSRSESLVLNSGLADHLASKAHYYARTW